MGTRHFKKGWLALSQISRTERKHMAKILLACLIGLDMATDAIKACQDFIYLTQFTLHNEGSLARMQCLLNQWAEHRHTFVETGTREDFNIPKFHSLVHYIEMIRLFGTTDNYNTKMFERLHINFTKKGWRASNKRDKFPQMTTWLSCQENVATFDRYIAHWQHERLEAQERKRKDTERKERAEWGETSMEKEGTDMVPQENPSGQDRDSERQDPMKDTMSLAQELQEKRGMHLTKSCSATRMLLSIETLHKIPKFRKHLTAFLSLHQRTQL
ncbi:hypothetical protein PM082_016847 [Marasmius tenuissimus]|nr:hypothetical protein PM082_016847 [Marasmius tenuissimus]